MAEALSAQFPMDGEIVYLHKQKNATVYVSDAAYKHLTPEQIAHNKRSAQNIAYAILQRSGEEKWQTEQNHS